jgi:hypothetical protein
MTESDLRAFGLDDDKLIAEFHRLNPERFRGSIELKGDGDRARFDRGELFELVTTEWMRDPGVEDG